MRVTAFSGGPRVPSARLRVHQLVEPLHNRGVEVRTRDANRSSYPPASILPARLYWGVSELICRSLQLLHERPRPADVTLIQREFISGYATLERFAVGPTVFDVDDAIWLNQHKRLRTDQIAASAAVVIAGNSFVADYYSTATPTVILPTAVDVKRYNVGFRDHDRPRIGWCGQSSGFRYLRSVIEPIQNLLRAFPTARFSVMADREPELALPLAQFEFVPWSIRGEIQFLSSLDVGIMPLHDGPWERGKCSYKMLTYMASGVPVVVSPVGMNAELLAKGDIGYGASSTDEWFEAIHSILEDEQRAAEMGLRGREIAEQEYAIEVIADRLADILRLVT